MKKKNSERNVSPARGPIDVFLNRFIIIIIYVRIGTEVRILFFQSHLRIMIKSGFFSLKTISKTQFASNLLKKFISKDDKLSLYNKNYNKNLYNNERSDVQNALLVA